MFGTFLGKTRWQYGLIPGFWRIEHRNIFDVQRAGESQRIRTHQTCGLGPFLFPRRQMETVTGHMDIFPWETGSCTEILVPQNHDLKSGCLPAGN